VKHLLLAATSARGKARQWCRVHEPQFQPLKSRQDVQIQNIKSENNTGRLPAELLVNIHPKAKKPIPEPYRSESFVLAPVPPLWAWPEESDDCLDQISGTRRQLTIPSQRATANPTTPSQFIWSKRLKPSTPKLNKDNRHGSSIPFSESTETPCRGSGEITNARGLPRGKNVPQSFHQLNHAIENQSKKFLTTLLNLGQPLIPELKIAIEAEAKPERQAVNFASTPKKMEGRLQVRQPEMSLHKAKAVEDARQAQAAVNEMCRLAGRPPPIWALCELIGKGTYGRVYMG
jgi:hypothetical protein